MDPYTYLQQLMAQRQMQGSGAVPDVQMGGAGGMVQPGAAPGSDYARLQQLQAIARQQQEQQRYQQQQMQMYPWGNLPQVPQSNLGMPPYLMYQNGKLPWEALPHVPKNISDMKLTDPKTYLGWDEATRGNVNDYFSTIYLPNQTNQLNWYQAVQNARQFYDTLNEQNRLNTFGMDLQGKEYGLKEYLSKQQLDQWNRQFGFQQKQWQDQYGLDQQKQQLDDYYKRGLISNDQYAGQTERLRQQSQEQQWQQELAGRNQQWQQELGWGKEKFGAEQERGKYEFGEQQKLERERQQNDLTQSRYAAFGRAQAPTARWASNW